MLQEELTAGLSLIRMIEHHLELSEKSFIICGGGATSLPESCCPLESPPCKQLYYSGHLLGSCEVWVLRQGEFAHQQESAKARSIPSVTFWEGSGGALWPDVRGSHWHWRRAGMAYLC